jgi:DNA-binding response OmpR family regulator
MHKILILEDDLHLRATLEEELIAEGFDITGTDSSDSVLDLTFEQRFDLYLFDVNVIGMDGFSLLQALQESGDQTPTIFLTSKNKTTDVIEGFGVGASDYLRKPFEMEELIVRILRFLLTKKEYFISENICYYPETYQIQNNGEKSTLKQKEGQILEYFLNHSGEIISKEKILEDIYEGEYITDSTFRGYINKIKSAIGTEYLRNIRGEGYILETV